FGMADVAGIDELEVEPGGIPEFERRGRDDGDDQRIAEARQSPHRSLGDRIGRVFLPLALVPRLQLDERNAGILSLAGEGEAADRENGLDVLLLLGEEIILRFLQGTVGAWQGCTRRAYDERKYVADVLIGKESGGKAPKRKCHYGANQHIGECGALCAA